MLEKDVRSYEDQKSALDFKLVHPSLLKALDITTQDIWSRIPQLLTPKESESNRWGTSFPLASDHDDCLTGAIKFLNFCFITRFFPTQQSSDHLEGRQLVECLATKEGLKQLCLLLASECSTISNTGGVPNRPQISIASDLSICISGKSLDWYQSEPAQVQKARESQIQSLG